MKRRIIITLIAASAVMVGTFVGLKIYAASQWPSLEDVADIAVPEPFAQGDPKVWKAFESIVLERTDKQTARDVKNISRYNYKAEDTTNWKGWVERLNALKNMRSFSNMEQPNPPLGFQEEGIDFRPSSFLLKLNVVRSWDAINNDDMQEAIGCSVRLLDPVV